MTEFKVLIGGENFAEIRRGKYCYIDKTGFLNDFLPLPAKVSLFTRPRRFGKTLFLSMLAEFFDIARDSRELFAGLRISASEELCAQWMNQYPVIFLSLKDVDKPSYARAVTRFQEEITDFCKNHKFLLSSDRVAKADKVRLQKYLDSEADEDTVGLSLETLINAMASHYGRPAIVLIDEYDVPVAKAEANGYYGEMTEFMRGLFSSALKTSQDSLLFAVLAGCLGITKGSIFTGLNNIKCFGIPDSRFADAVGFTQAEVDQLLADAGLSARKEEVKAWYDGYCFGAKQEIYCPWSIMNYVSDVLAEPDTPPQAYWLHTSDNEFVRKLIDHSSAGCPGACDVIDSIASLLAGDFLPAHISVAPGYNDLTSSPENIWTLLYYTGYLTKASKGVADKLLLPGSGFDLLRIPNKEVASIFNEELKEWFSRHLTSAQRSDLYQAFWEPDAERFGEMLSQTLLVSISMYDYKEHFYHGMLTGLFISTRAQTVSNLEAGEGRSDILVQDGSMAAVIEVKCTKDAGELPSLVEKGMKQIADNKYDALFRANPSVSTILHWSIAFCKKSCLAKAVVASEL